VVVKVASDRCGSHVIEKAYRAATVEKKKTLVDALAKEYKALVKTHFGAMVCRRCRVDQFVAGAEAWEEGEKKAVKKRDLFADIIGEDGGGEGGRKGGKHGGGGDGEEIEGESQSEQRKAWVAKGSKAWLKAGRRAEVEAEDSGGDAEEVRGKEGARREKGKGKDKGNGSGKKRRKEADGAEEKEGAADAKIEEVFAAFGKGGKKHKTRR
jgi:hypothetical protein